MMNEEEFIRDGNNVISIEIEPVTTPSSTTNTNEDSFHLSLSLSSMVGLSTPHSLKIRGKIRDRDVVVLID